MIGWPASKPLTNSMSTQDSANWPGLEGPAMWMPSTRSPVLVWVVTSNGPFPVATIGALYTTSEPLILMNGLYPGPATAPGWNLASGNPSGPGAAMRVGLKSGAPAKFTTAGPNGFCCGAGEPRVRGCTAAGPLIAILASLGA